MRRTVLITLAFILSGCASGVNVTPVNIQPIQQIKSDPFDPDETLVSAKKMFEQENYTGALGDFLKVSAYDPQRQDARLGMADSFLALGQYKRAARIFWHPDPAWQEGEYTQEIAVGKILSGIYTQQFDNVETAINDGMVLDPNDARLWNAKGRWHDGRREWMEALSCYVAAMELGQWRSGTINNMGMSLLMQDRTEEAKEKFLQAVDLSRDTEIYDNNLRMTHILQGNLRAALDDIADRRAANILNDAGYVAFKKDKFELAEMLFSKALEISPIFHADAQANLDLLRETAPTP